MGGAPPMASGASGPGGSDEGVQVPERADEDIAGAVFDTDAVGVVVPEVADLSHRFADWSVDELGQGVAVEVQPGDRGDEVFVPPG